MILVLKFLVNHKKIHQTSKKTQPHNCSYTVYRCFFLFNNFPTKKKPPYGNTQKTQHRFTGKMAVVFVSPSFLPTPSPSSRAVPSRPVGNTQVGTCSPYTLWDQLPSLKLTASLYGPENGWLEYFLVSFWVLAYFQVRAVSFREGNKSQWKQ